jgi:pimeloyl-ACP methyl ester carboxylesterase
MRLSIFGLAAAAVFLLTTSVAASADTATIGRPVVFYANVDTDADGNVDVVYEIHGDIVGPANVLKAGSTANGITLYLHGFGHGEWIWNMGVPGYNFAKEMAATGHTSLIIDRLGYDQSAKPAAGRSSIGVQAEITHQIIGKLRTGDYKTDSGTPWRFNGVALAGLSAGGLIAEREVEIYNDVDALGVFGWYDEINDGTYGTPLVVGPDGAFPQMAALCVSSTSGYEYFGQTADEFQRINFAPNANPSVVKEAIRQRNPDPCGDALSIPDILIQGTLIQGAASTSFSQLGVIGEKQVPTLLMWGDQDGTFQMPKTAERQLYVYQSAYASAHANPTLVQQSIIPGSGHLLPLGNPSVFRAGLGGWLGGLGRGF